MARSSGGRIGGLVVVFVIGAALGGVVGASVASESDDADQPSAEAADGDSTPPATPSITPSAPAEERGVTPINPSRVRASPSIVPFPFTSPTPSPAATPIDGTYLRILTLEELGGARIALPYRCLRCPAYRLDPGVSTIVFHEGAYYFHHHLSGFRTLGSYVIDGDRITLFNDPTCPDTAGVYEFATTARGVRFDVVEDDCPISNERAIDLTTRTWTRVSACVRRIQNLWPGDIAC